MTNEIPDPAQAGETFKQATPEPMLCDCGKGGRLKPAGQARMGWVMCHDQTALPRTLEDIRRLQRQVCTCRNTT